jgi:hypothetical protein
LLAALPIILLNLIMKTSNVPGYKELYPNGNDRYSELVKEISSETIIRVCGALNNELNGKGGMVGNQAGIFKDFSKTFTVEERRELLAAVTAYQAKIGEEARLLFFGTRYLVSMVIKELNHFRKINHPVEDKPLEYQLFKAYLLIIDEEAAKDHLAIDFKKLVPDDPLNLMRVLILPVINQFEFNERSDMLFETYKSACFLKYLQNSSYRPYLKEWLNDLHFKNVGAYLASFNQINQTIHNFDPEAKMLKRLNYIKPDEGVDQTHLQRLSVNLQAKGKYTLTELKKAPLVYAADRAGYLVVDYNYSNKKMFRGAFFETCHTTTLTNRPELSPGDKQAIFNTYSQQASDAFESSYFKPVIQLLTGTGCDVVYFDDRTANIPDAYVRIGHNVLLFEFKAYVFREDLAAKPNFDKLIAYLEDRFVNSDADKPKGVGQLVEQIKLFHQGYFKFDPVANELLNKGQLHFYPILVHNDFNFSLPGINTYLNQRMWDLLAKNPNLIDSVKPLVMLNLETILDILLTGGDAPDLGHLVFLYYNFLQQVRSTLPEQPTMANFATGHCSFDEFYHAFIEKPRITEEAQRQLLHRLLKLSGIDFDEFKQDL